MPTPSMRYAPVWIAASAILLAAGLLVWSTRPGSTREEVRTLLSASETILGQTLAYPTGGPAKVTAAVITMQPGDERGWHKHDVPLLGYILEGELTVDLGPAGKRVFKKGEAFLEAVGVAHNGRNLGSGPVRVLAVFIGEEGVPNTVEVKAPQ